MAAFFTSLLPQFVPAGEPAFLPVLLLGLLFCTMTLVWLTAYAVVVSRAQGFLRRTGVKRHSRPRRARCSSRSGCVWRQNAKRL